MAISAITYPKALKPAFQKQAVNPIEQSAKKENAIFEYENKIANQNNLVKKHENAHLAFSGSQAVGSPQYQVMMDPDGRKIITGGYQVIAIPAMANKNMSFGQIDKTEKAAQATINGATAPASFDELSAADKAVAFQGYAVLSSARTARQQRQEKTNAKPNNGKESKEGNGKTQKPAVVGARLNMMG